MSQNIIWIYGNGTESMYKDITDYEINYERGYAKFIDEHGNYIVHHGKFTFVMDGMYMTLQGRERRVTQP